MISFDEREECDGAFPFCMEVEFRMTICFTETEFKISVNKAVFASFEYRTPNQLDKLGGFKIAGENGLHVNITSVDHKSTDSVDFEEIKSDSDQIRLLSNVERKNWPLPENR